MKKLLFIIFLGLLCYYGVMLHNAINRAPDVEMIVDDNLLDILNEWKQDIENKGIHYHTQFDRLKEIRIVEDSVLGEGKLAYADLFRHTIRISKTCAMKGYWTTKAALYHELGHYVYGLDHIEGPYIMNEYHHEGKDVEQNWEFLKTAYLSRCKQNESYAKF